MKMLKEGKRKDRVKTKKFYSLGKGINEEQEARENLQTFRKIMSRLYNFKTGKKLSQNVSINYMDQGNSSVTQFDKLYKLIYTGWQVQSVPAVPCPDPFYWASTLTPPALLAANCAHLHSYRDLPVSGEEPLYLDKSGQLPRPIPTPPRWPAANG